MNKKSELIREWLHKAEHDLGMANLALKYEPKFTDSICFHCQQAVEKYLKAYLLYLDIAPPKTHSLVYLLDLIDRHQPISDEVYSKVEQLESYAVEIRYPDDWYEPTKLEAMEAYQIAKEMKEMVLNFFEERGGEYGTIK